MTATAHALVGGAIAASTHDPILGFSLAVASHPLLDITPHWDAAWNWRAKSRILFFMEALADVCVGPLITYWFWNWRFPPFSWSHRIQSQLQGKAKLPWGVVSQVVTVGLVLLIAFQFIK